MTQSSDNLPQPGIPGGGWDAWGNFSWLRFGLLILAQLVGTSIGFGVGVVCFWSGANQLAFYIALCAFLGFQFAIIWIVAMLYLKRLLAARDAAQKSLEEAGWSARETSEWVDTGTRGVCYVVHCHRGQQEVAAQSRDRIKAWLEATRKAREGEWSVGSTGG
jgi:membrane protein implicated in regulation of membrane protease activity